MGKWYCALLIGFVVLQGCAEEPTLQPFVVTQALDGDPGPVEMLIDIAPNEGGAYFPSRLVTAGTHLFFVADVGGLESEDVLCSTDGSQDTVVMRDAEVLAGPVAWGTDVYFIAKDTLLETAEVIGLFRSDGTSEGTVMVAELGDAETHSATTMELVGEQLVFVFSTPDVSRRLWRSDGTEDGTGPLAEPGSMAADALPQALFVVGDQLYFAGLHADTGLELFVTDGTADGTRLVKDINSGDSSGLAYADWEPTLTPSEDVLYFVANDGENGKELWVSDGSEEGTTMVADIMSGVGDSSPNDMIWFDGDLFFSARHESYGRELWASDGSEEGTRLVADIREGSSNGGEPSSFAVYDDQLHFLAWTGRGDTDVYTTDGTELGTTIAIDFDWTEASGFLTDMFALDDVLVMDVWTVNHVERLATKPSWEDVESVYVMLDTEYANMGPPVLFDGSIWFDTSRLWRSDGTGDGTIEATRPLVVRSNSDGYPQQFTHFDDQLWFIAEDTELGLEIFYTDGTEGNTAVLGDLAGHFGADDLTAGDEVMYFSQYDGSGHQQATIWRTDGTYDGSRQVSEVVPDSSYSYPNYLTTVGDLVYFSYQVYSKGTHLWVSDGTLDGTRQVVDLYADHGDDVRIVGTFGEKVLFRADAGAGLGLWITEGTAETTVELIPGLDGSTAMIEFDGSLLFGAEVDDGMELWTSDGTPEGTSQLPELFDGAGDGVYRLGAILGQSASATTHYFVGNDGIHGNELWITDGTADGTRMVADIYEGEDGSSPRRMAFMDGILYFVANDGVHGSELWRSNGTEGGTEMVADIIPGLASGCNGWENSWRTSTFPVPEAAVVLFAARTAETNVELWISDGTEAGTNLYMDLAPGAQSSSPMQFNRVGDNIVFLADDGLRGVELWTVPVEALSDPVPPEIVCPDNRTAEATGPLGARVTFEVTATDTVTAEPQIQLSHESGATFPLGTTVVTAAAIDEAGNRATCDFEVLVQDTTAPDIQCPENVAVEAGEGATEWAVEYGSAQATDSVSGVVTPTFSQASGSVFPIGATTVTATADDEVGNSSSCDFEVTVYEFGDDIPVGGDDVGVGGDAGSSDGGDMGSDFTERPTGTGDQSNPDPTSGDSDRGGCSASGQAVSSLPWLLAIGLILGGRRRNSPS